MFAKRTEWELAPNRFAAALEKHRGAGRPLLDLTASNPTRIGLRYDPALLAALAQSAALDYSPDPRGLGSTREAVARYYADEDRAAPSPAQIVLTSSTSEAYSFCFRLLCEPGDEVLAAAPSYPLFDFLADLQDVHLRPYSLFYDYGWHIDFESLCRAIGERTRAIVVVNPNNPTGSYLKPAELEELNRLCERHQLALISDEVFLDFARESRAGFSLAANHAALTFTLSGLSKISGLPQMKLGWIVVSGPAPLRQPALDRLEVIADTYLSVSTPVQLAGPRFLQFRREFQDQLNRQISTNLDVLDRALAGQRLCSRLIVESGWYAVLRVPVTRSDEDLAIELLEKHSVLVHPGHFYDFAQDGFLVLSLITPLDDFREGVDRTLTHLQAGS